MLRCLLVLALLWCSRSGSAWAQVRMGLGTQLTYDAVERRAWPGINGHLSGSMGLRLRWHATIQWHAPHVVRLSRTVGGLRQLATGDTATQYLELKTKAGLPGITFGIVGALGRHKNGRGLYWHGALAVMDRTTKSEYRSRYVYTGEQRNGSGRHHVVYYGLHAGIGYRKPMGAHGEGWLEAGTLPLALGAGYHPQRTTVHGLLFPRITLGYGFKLGD